MYKVIKISQKANFKNYDEILSKFELYGGYFYRFNAREGLVVVMALTLV